MDSISHFSPAIDNIGICTLLMLNSGNRNVSIVIRNFFYGCGVAGTHVAGHTHSQLVYVDVRKRYVVQYSYIQVSFQEQFRRSASKLRSETDCENEPSTEMRLV